MRVRRAFAASAFGVGLAVGVCWVATPFYAAVHVPASWWTLPLAAGVGIIVALLVQGMRRVRPWAVLVVMALVGSACAPTVHALADNPLPAAHLGHVGRKAPALTAAEVEAAEWVAAHNTRRALVATNVHCGELRTTPHCTADGFWVSAFTESPVLVGGWGYSTSARVHHGDGGLSYLRQPYRPADVGRLNDEAFTAPSMDVLNALRAKGVRYIFADARASVVSPRIGRFATKVLDRDGVQVFELR